MFWDYFRDVVCMSKRKSFQESCVQSESYRRLGRRLKQPGPLPIVWPGLGIWIPVTWFNLKGNGSNVEGCVGVGRLSLEMSFGW